MSGIVLYELRRCPYCAKVRQVLEELDLEYESRSVPRARADRDEIQAISDQTSVPVLVDDAHNVEGLADSDDIIAYLQATYGDPA